jgi:sensor domain CHASE-containing protein
MGDLVVGLAKSVVEGVLTKAQSAIEEESKLQQSAQRDLVFITGEF